MRGFVSISLLSFLHLIGTTTSAQPGIFRTYTVGDGLVNNSVRRIFQDSKGFLWISTWEGLSKYDGNRFTNFTESNGLSHNLVNDVVELPSGDIYVAMNNGSVDVIKNDRIKQRQIFTNVVINRFQVSKTGALLGSTDSAGMVEINGSNIRYLNKREASCYGAVSLNDSLIAVATDTLPVTIYNKQFDIWSVAARSVNGATSNCVFKDLQNRLWIGTTKGLRLVAVDYVKHQVKLVNPPAPLNQPLLSQGYINCIFQEENNNLWIGTGQGLIRVSPDGQLKQFTELDGLPSRFISHIFCDRENNMWIGTGLGLAKIIAPAATAVPQLFEGQPHDASIIERVSSNQLLIASDRFFYRYNFQTNRIENILQLQKDKNFTYVTNSSPALFIYGNELYHYDISSNSLIRQQKISSTAHFSQIGSATTTDQQTVFIPVVRAIMIYSQGRWLIDSTFKMRINNILADHKGYIWLGTWDRGLFRARYDVNSKKWVEIIQIAQLPDNHVRSLFEDREGNIWVGTRYNGLIRIGAYTLSGVHVIRIDQRTGLSSNWIAGFTEDAEENIWVISKSGIDKLVKIGDRFTIFNYSRIINFFPNVNLIEYTEGNKLICSSLQGIFQIEDEKVEQRSPQQVYLTKVGLAGKVKMDFTFHTGTQKVVLPYSTNSALFEFTSPTYLNEKEILYSYRMRGSNDTAWSHPGNSHSVQYASLSPGHYRFEVRMLGWNGKFGPVTEFSFIIRPPYWHTWWFYLAVALILSLLLYRLYRYRIDQLMRVQKVRNTIATDLHDDIGSTLTNISILSELSKKNLEQPLAAEQFLQRITEESVASQQALDDIIWSVNSRNDNIQELQARMRRYAAELFEGDNMQFEFKFDNTGSSRLNMEQRRDLYLAFKECLNNARKHASATNIHIKIAVTNGVLHMMIEDDGKGFDTSILTHRNGLKNLNSRIEKWNGNVKIVSDPGKGTQIEINMPVKTSLLK